MLLPRSKTIFQFPKNSANTGIAKRRFPILFAMLLVLVGCNAVSAEISGSQTTGPTISPYDFAAKGDGVTDDTAALNAAAEAASLQQGTLVIPKGNFVIRDFLTLRHGMRAVIGTGGTITLANTDAEAGLLMPFGEFPPSRLGRFRIQNVIIDANNNAAIAIYGQNVSNVDIIDNTITNLSRGAGILLRAFAENPFPVEQNVIRGNNVSGFAGDSSAWNGITVDANIRLAAGTNDMIEHWKKTFLPATVVSTTRNNLLENNTITGGYYGVSISAAANNRIIGNTITQNVRNISMQNSSTGNLVSGNTLRDSSSSSIHLAYGSSDNRIEFNNIRTTRAKGEGLLQAYVQSENNTFDHNTVVAAGNANPTFFAYTGIHANMNTFSNNVFVGSCSKAYFGIESAWNTINADPASRSDGNDPITNAFAKRNSGKITIASNRITATSLAPIVFLGQTSDEKGTYGLNGVEIRDNIATVLEGGTALRLFEATSGASSNHTVTGNRILTSTGANAIMVAPRGRAHFAAFSGNVGFGFGR